MTTVLTATVLVVAATAGWRQYVAHQAAQLPAHAWAPLASSTPADVASARTPALECAGKQHCTQMRSCEEAEFYIARCPDTHMGGDRDGKPCGDTCR